MRSRHTIAAVAAIACLQLVAPSGATAAATDEVVTRPGEVVIETVPGVSPSDPEVLASVEATRAEQQIAFDETAASSAPRRSAALTSAGIAVTFVEPSTPNDVRAVVNAAVADWNAALATSTNGPISLAFDWSNQGGSGVLGFAGPTQYIKRGDSFIPTALANTLDNRDYTDGHEIVVTIASEYYNTGWYVSTDANVPGNKIDLYGTILHEIGHGLGFLGSVQGPADNPRLADQPDKYDTLVSVDGAKLLTLPNPNGFLTSNNLDIAIGGGSVHRIYAPTRFLLGSSFSHFDELAYPSGSAGSLMTPSLSNGEVERQLDGPTLGVMAESGWPMDVLPLTPTIASTQMGQGWVTTNWAVDLRQRGTPATDYIVQALLNGGVVSAVTTPGAATTATLSGLTTGFNYTIRVTPRTNGKAGIPATTTIALVLPPGPPLFVSVIGSDFNRTVSWTAGPDGGSPITSYVIDASLNGGAYVNLGSTSDTSLATPTLTNDVYQFRVRAVSANGSSDYGYSLPVGFTNTVVRPFPLDGQIARLYQAYFRRAPDAAGMNYYLGLRAQGTSLANISSVFAVSSEFIDTYGQLGNRAFITQLYRNVLGREGDPAGINYWTGQLDTGASRGEVVVGFSESAEFIRATQTAAAQTSVDAAIYRLYLSYFLRPPDDAGSGYWSRQVSNGAPLTAVSEAFAASAEFVNRYGSLTNAQFMKLVYANVLTRQPDTAGFNFWLGRLDAGLGRGDVMQGFADSPEFVLRTGTVK